MFRGGRCCQSMAAPIGIAMILALSACSNARIVSDRPIPGAVQYRPEVVYVADFDLPSDALRSESLFANLPLHAWKERRQANSLVGLMSHSIIQDLQKKGLQAYRLPADAPTPTQGWLVRGAFVQVNEGNRAERALVGFGAGHTDLQVSIMIDELSTDRAPAPLYAIESASRSGKSPGAVITLNPFAAAFKFVLSGQDLDRDAKQSASKIAADVLAHINAAPHV